MRVSVRVYVRVTARRAARARVRASNSVGCVRARVCAHNRQACGSRARVRLDQRRLRDMYARVRFQKMMCACSPSSGVKPSPGPASSLS